MQIPWMGKSWFTGLSLKNILVESDYSIHWTSISLEEIEWCLWFINVDIHQGKVASEGNNFGWVCSGMPKLAKSAFD